MVVKDSVVLNFPTDLASKSSQRQGNIIVANAKFIGNKALVVFVICNFVVQSFLSDKKSKNFSYFLAICV